MNDARLTPLDLSKLDQAGFVARLGHVFEHSPWVAERAYEAGPFATVDALHAAMLGVLDRATPEERLALLRAHPELGAAVKLTQASAAEQGGLGLDRLADAEARGMAELNAAYRARFGFPFIIVVRGQKNRAAIEQALRERLAHAPDHEIGVALAQVARIARYRLDNIFPSPGGDLTVHVLDTARGQPAAGIGLELWRVTGTERVSLRRAVTNADGRADGPLLAGATLTAGTYEIVFDAGVWRGAEAGFYDQIPIRFRVDDPARHHHVPLLLSPYGYTTYRGS